MKRFTAALAIAAIGSAGLLTAACNDKSGASGGNAGGDTKQNTGGGGDYCANVKSYLEVAKTGDPGKFVGKAKDSAASAPAEIKSQWDLVVRYMESAKPGSAPKPEDGKALASANMEIVKHAQEKCGLTLS